MRRIKGLFSVLLIIIILASCAKKDPPDFRQIRWGMSLQQVYSLETAAKLEEVYIDDDLLIFNGDFYDEPVDIIYSFVDDNVTEARVDFIAGERSMQDMMDVFDSVAQQLTEQYGQPVNPDKMVWVYDGRRGSLPNYFVLPDSDNPEDDYIYLLYNLLIYYLEWETDRTAFRLCLEDKTQYDISLYLEAVCLADLD